MSSKNRIRADCLAFQQGLANSQKEAQSLIMSGEIIIADGNPTPQKVAKPGQQLSQDTRLAFLPRKTWVSRGAAKLLTLLEGCQLDVDGMVCLDAGASTGGFTDCLLQRGAKKVYAVDVGKNQLHEKLRADPRVISMEGVNLRCAPPDLLPEKVDLLTGDLSFISLTLVLPVCIRWLKPGGLAAMLIKPQFELEPGEMEKGIVRKEEYRQKAVRKITVFCVERLRMSLEKVLPSSIRGPKGNQEYMALFRASKE